MSSLFNPTTNAFAPVRDSINIFDDPSNPFPVLPSDSELIERWLEPSEPDWREEWDRWGEYSLGEQVPRPTYTPADDLNMMFFAQALGFGPFWAELSLPNASPAERALRTGLNNSLENIQSDETLTLEDTIACCLRRTFSLARVLKTLPRFKKMSPFAATSFAKLVEVVGKDMMYHDTVNFYEGSRGFPVFEEIIENPFLPDEDKEIIFDIGDLIDEWLDENPLPLGLWRSPVPSPS